MSTPCGTFDRGCGLWQSVQATPAMLCVEECQAIVGEWRLVAVQAQVLPRRVEDFPVGVVAGGAVESVGAADLVRAGDPLQVRHIAVAAVADVGRNGAQVVRRDRRRRGGSCSRVLPRLAGFARCPAGASSAGLSAVCLRRLGFLRGAFVVRRVAVEAGKPRWAWTEVRHWEPAAQASSSWQRAQISERWTGLSVLKLHTSPGFLPSVSTCLLPGPWHASQDLPLRIP